MSHSVQSKTCEMDKVIAASAEPLGPFPNTASGAFLTYLRKSTRCKRSVLMLCPHWCGVSRRFFFVQSLQAYPTDS